MRIQIEITIQNVYDNSCGNSRDILLQIIDKLPEGLFKHTQLSLEFIMDCSTFKGVPLPDNPVSSKPFRSMTAIIGNGVLTEVVKCAKEFLKFLVSLEEQCHSTSILMVLAKTV